MRERCRHADFSSTTVWDYDACEWVTVAACLACQTAVRIAESVAMDEVRRRRPVPLEIRDIHVWAITCDLARKALDAR